ncbi:uncharacterized protein EV154DRAFT_488564 [Mucor mucedo]|uniref:uncharacterized protein n=1 Tax=Mucor mucedo TaxID=29922 RepID=UPI00221EFB28|nr:uncharacterized protein EV154DRAFT_488564 [Mucor mucedo]KAI7866390.1 hypothetical protein EV154DRAFT_488564 [Mucor mucedo]
MYFHPTSCIILLNNMDFGHLLEPFYQNFLLRFSAIEDCHISEDLMTISPFGKYKKTMLLTSTGSHKETSGCFVKHLYSNYCTLRNIVENDETLSETCTDEYIPTSVREIAEVHVGGSILGYCGYNILVAGMEEIYVRVRISISTYTMWGSTPPQIDPHLLQLFNVHLLGNDVSSYDDDIITAVNTWHRVYVESSIYIFS